MTMPLLFYPHRAYRISMLRMGALRQAPRDKVSISLKQVYTANS